MATMHDAWQKEHTKSQSIRQIPVSVMEPHLPQGNMSNNRKLSALKVKTSGDGSGPSPNVPLNSTKTVTTSDKLSRDVNRKLIVTKPSSNVPSQRQRTEISDDDTDGLTRNLGGSGQCIHPRSPGETREIYPFGRVDSAGSSKSDSYRRQNSAGRPDSSGYISGASVTSTPDRPSSALARGVKITEFKENKVNPEPVVLEDTDLILEDHLSTRKLRALTGRENLEDVRFLELKVDTRETSLGNFGSHLPNLSQLKLSNSIITSIRDLGSSLNNVTVLWMSRCGLEDLDGLSSMNNLRELYLAYNEIYDISPCSMLEHIKILDLEGNNLEELSQVEFLALCSTMTHLTLEGNPLCTTPSPDEASPDYDYRQAVKQIIPHLENLDDAPLVAGESGKSGSVFEDDWRLIEELLEEGNVIQAEDDIDLGVAGYRPGTAIRPTTGYRPGSALKQQVSRPLTKAGRTGLGRPGSSLGRPGSSMGRPVSSMGRPGSSLGRPGSARPGSARPGSGGGRPGSAPGDDEENLEDSSDLTLGGVVCGNPSKALRMRSRTRQETPPKQEHKEKLFAQLREKTADNFVYDPSELEEDPTLSGLLSEVNAWKKEHQKTRDQIEAERAPQILMIDHDDAVSLSGDDESLDSDSDDEMSSGYYSNRSRQLQTDFSSTASLSSSWQQQGGTGAAGSPCSSASHRRRRLQHDESFEARDEGSPAASSVDLRGLDRLTEQPTSPSQFSRDRASFDPRPPLQQIRSPDKTTNPAIRSPESPTTTPPGAQKLPGFSSRMRKSNLISKVPILPSKPGQFK